MAVTSAPHDMHLVDIAEFIFSEASFDARLKTIRWLQAISLLATQMTCSCAGSMILIKRDFTRGKQDVGMEIPRMYQHQQCLKWIMV